MGTKCKDEVVTLTLTTSAVKDAVKTYTLSKRYINTMLKATLINILHHRLDIDEKEFITKTFNDIPYKTFRPKSKNHYIRDFHSYMGGCKDAINKNYLREFYLFFVDKNSADIVENYKFSFHYSKKVNPDETQSSEDLFDSTCELLKTLQDLEKNRKVSGEVDVKAELTYFEDTPAGYEPPGFRAANDRESFMNKVDSKGISVTLGTLFTGFHKMKCRGKGNVFNLNSSLSTIHADAEVIDINDSATNIGEQLQSDTAQAVVNQIFTEDLDPITTTSPIKDKENLSRTRDSYNVTAYIDVSSDEDPPIDCPCKLKKVEEVVLDQVVCNDCKRKYHAACQGYLDATFVRRPFRCNFCGKDDDSVVETFEIKKTLALYRMRFMVGAMYKYGEMPEELKRFFTDVVQKLRDFNIFTLEGRTITDVNPDFLGNLFNFGHKMVELNKFKLF